MVVANYRIGKCLAALEPIVRKMFFQVVVGWAHTQSGTVKHTIFLLSRPHTLKPISNFDFIITCIKTLAYSKGCKAALTPNRIPNLIKRLAWVSSLCWWAGSIVFWIFDENLQPEKTVKVSTKIRSKWKRKKPVRVRVELIFFFCMEKTLLKEFRFGVWQSPLNGSVLEWERPQHRIRNRWQFVCCLNNTYAFYCHSVNCFKWLHWYLMKNPTKYSNIGTFNKRTFPATRIPFDTNWMWFCFVIVSAKKCIGQIWIDFVFVSFICISVVDRVIFCWVTVQQRIFHSHCTVPSASKV